MSNESAFSANMRLAIAGHDVQVTVRGTDGADFQVNWAHLAENMQEFIESVHRTVAASNASGLVVSAPSTAPGAPPADNPWTPTQTAAPAAADPWGAAPAPEPAGPAPMCDHGQAMKLVPAGISKKTGQPYKAFYVCAAPQKAQQCQKTVRL